MPDQHYDVRSIRELMVLESVPALARYAGILQGVAGIADDIDPIMIGCGGALYLGARWAAVTIQDRFEMRRFETLERRLK